MKARLILLIVVAGGLAVWIAARPKMAASTSVDAPDAALTEAERLELLRIREMQKMLGNRDLPGRKPPEEPDVHVGIEVDVSSGKNRLYFTISEAHGYYVETFQLEAWYVDENTTGPDDAPLRVSALLDIYLKENETLRECIEVVPAELSHIGGDIGKTADWDVQLISYGRARAKNPDRLPLISDAARCFD